MPSQMEVAMVQMNMEVAWTFRVNAAESILILKGLAGILKPGEQKAAQELLERLSAQRTAEARQLLDSLTRFTPEISGAWSSSSSESIHALPHKRICANRDTS